MSDSTIPTVSVVVAVRDEEKYIGRCIRSILNQTYPRSNFEVIVINDASSDRTSYALDLFKEEIRIINNEKQIGLPGSLNKGIRIARGRFVVRIDGDDYVHQEYLNMLSLFLALNDSLDAVACDYQLVDNDGKVLSQPNWLDSPIGCGIMFRTEQLIELGLYDENFLMHEDEDLRLRFQESYSIYRIAIPLYRYRQHDDNMTRDKDKNIRYVDALGQKHGKNKIRRQLTEVKHL